jgi:hypothetical protein
VSVVKINAITVPRERFEEFEQREGWRRGSRRRRATGGRGRRPER